MAGCYESPWRKARGTRAQFRLNTQGLIPFKCTYPVHLTDVMDIGQSSQSGVLRGVDLVSPNQGTRTRTVREYEQAIKELTKENFDLKLRIYLLEESNKNNRKDNDVLCEDKDNTVEVIIGLKIETESLRNELSNKEKLLQDALDQAEKHVLELQNLQKECNQFQQQLAEKLPSKAEYILLKDEKSNLEEEIKSLESLLFERNEDLEKASAEIEKLSSRNKHLEVKTQKSSVAIQGFVYKHYTELEMIPKEVRPTIKSAVQAARNNDHKTLVAAIQHLKETLCDMMTVPLKSCEIDSAESSPDVDSQAKCLKAEMFEPEENFNRAASHQSDPSVQLHKFQDFKDVTKRLDLSAENSLDNLEIIQQEYSTEQMLSNSATSPAGSVLIEVLENPTSLLLPKFDTKYASVSARDFNVTRHSSLDSEKEVNIKSISLPILSSQSVKSVNSDRKACDVLTLNSTLIENEHLKSEIAEKLKEIEELNSVCIGLEAKEKEAETELKEALKQIKQLESKLSDRPRRKHFSSLLSISTQTSPIEDQRIEIKENHMSLMNTAQSNNIGELKEENLMLVLTIEEKEKEFAEMKQVADSLKTELENVLNRRELREDLNEKHNLHEQLAQSCAVNNELMKHLHSLEAFMEDLLHQKNLDESSLDNVSETSHFLLQLSKRLDESLKLSRELSDHLSICEGSRIFETDASMFKEDSIFESKSDQHLNLSKLSVTALDAKSKSYEGRNNFVPCHLDSFKTARTGKRCSLSSQHTSALLCNPDNVVVLGTSNNEDLILLLNENGDPADVLIRNNFKGAGDYKLDNFIVQTRDKRIKPLWGDSAWRDVTSNYLVQSSKYGQTKSPSHPWYNHCMSSDSDIWSEPDRDISLQRIGIEIKTSPVTSKSPRKLRFKDKRTADEQSSEKNSSSFGVYRAQTWSRRRRSSGSASRRLFMKESLRKNDSLEKHYSMLQEKISKFTVASSQLEKLKNLNIEKPDIIHGIADELNKVISSINETLYKLEVIKENSKGFAPFICEKCSITELLLDLEKTRKRMYASDLFESINEQKIEHLTQKFLSEVDDLKKQLEESQVVSLSDVEKSDNELTKSLESVKSKSVLNQELEDVKNKHLTLNKDLNCLKSEKNNLLKDLVNAKEEVEYLQKELEKINDEKNMLKEQWMKIEDQNKKLENQLQTMENKCETIKAEKKKILDEKEFIEKEKEEIKDKSELISKQLKENIEKSEMLIKQLEKVENDKEDLNKELLKSKDHSKLLEQNLKEAERKSVEKKNALKFNLNELTDKEEKLSEEYESVLDQLIEAESKNQFLENDMNKLKDQFNLLEIELEKANEKCRVMEKEKNFLNQKNDFIVDQFESSKDRNAKELQEVESKRKSLENQLVEVKQRVMSIEKEKMKIQENSDFTTKQLEKVKALKESLEQDGLNMQSAIKLLEEELGTTNSKNKSLEIENLELKKEKNLAEKEKKKTLGILSEKLKDFENTKGHLEKELKEIKNSNEMLKKELDVLRETLKNEKKLVADLREENFQLTNEVSNLHKKMNNVEIEKQNLSMENANTSLKLNEANKKNSDLKSLMQDLERKSSNSDEICSKLQSELSKTKEQLMNLDSKCAQYEMQLSLEFKNKKEHQLKIQTLENEVLEGKKIFSRDLSKLSSENSKILEEYNIEKEKRYSLEKEKKNLAIELSETKEEISKLNALKLKLQDENSALLKEKEVIEEELIASKSLCNDFKKDLEAMGDSLQRLECKCLNYEREMLLSTNFMNGFIQKLETIKKELIANAQNIAEIYDIGVYSVTAEKQKDLLSEKSSPSNKGEFIDKLCTDIILKTGEYFKAIAHLTRDMKEKNLLLEEKKTKEENYKLKFHALEKQLEIQQIELNHIKKQKSDLNNALEEYLRLISEKENLINLKESEIHSLRLQLLDIENGVEQDKHQLKQLDIQEIEKNKLKKYSEHLQLVIEELRQNILDKEKYLSNCDSEIYSLKLQLIALKEKIENSDSQINAKDNEITRLQERIFNLQIQVNNLLTEKDFYQQEAKKLNKVTKDAETSVEHLSSMVPKADADSDFSSKGIQTEAKFDDTLSSKCGIEFDESMSSPQNKSNNLEQLLKKNSALEAKLFMSSKRIEILEHDKKELRKEILEISRNKASMPDHESLNKKISELESELDKKITFIKELKGELYRTYNSLVKKQDEVDELRRKLSAIDNFNHDSHSVHESSSFEADINNVRKHKWGLLNAILEIQNKFYKTKDIHLNHFQKFKSHVEKLHSLQESPKLSKSESDPILNSQMPYSLNNIAIQCQRLMKNASIGLEIDVEFLENLKIFLNRFFLPFTEQNKIFEKKSEKNAVCPCIFNSPSKSNNEETCRHGCGHVIKMSMLEMSYPVNNLEEPVKDMKKNECKKMIYAVSQRVDKIENILKSFDSECFHAKTLKLPLEDNSCNDPSESLIAKILDESKRLLESTKIFHLNEELKSSGIFCGTPFNCSSKQDVSDRESLLSEETIALSRSESLSPVSFEENLPKTVSRSLFHNEKISQDYEKSQTAKLEIAGSSQDSVCQRSHYSSPDLGIESDPNHDSSAPEQTEKCELKLCSKYEAELMIRAKNNGCQQQKAMFTNTESGMITDTETLFAGGDTLRAVGILREYELLKREVQESLVGIKSVLSRTGDGLHHIAKYTSPRKNLEYSTLKAIKDTCVNIEVCLKEAYKLVNNFEIQPCPTIEEWNSILKQNQELCKKITMLNDSITKKEKEFKDAMDKLQHAHLIKESMERKISKKLVKTKKIIRRAELKLLENKCQSLASAPNFAQDLSSCQDKR